jgi:Bacterial HORMA domain family 1
VTSKGKKVKDFSRSPWLNENRLEAPSVVEALLISSKKRDAEKSWAAPTRSGMALPPWDVPFGRWEGPLYCGPVPSDANIWGLAGAVQAWQRKYSVDSSGYITSADRLGRIISGIDVSGTTFRTYLTRSAAWDALSFAQKAAIEEKLPILRKVAPEYKSSLGVWQYDRTYSASGVALTRQTFKLYGT